MTPVKVLDFTPRPMHAEEENAFGLVVYLAVVAAALLLCGLLLGALQ